MNTTQVFYRFLQNNHLEGSSEEYQWYESSAQNKESLQHMASDFQSHIIQGRNELWLIPDPENQLIAYTRPMLRKRLGSKNPESKKELDSVEYNLVMFLLLVLLNEFYGTIYGSGRMRPYLPLDEWMDQFEKALKNIAENDEEMHSEISFKDLYEKYRALNADMDHPNKNGYRRKLYSMLIDFLKEQKLVQWNEELASVAAG